MNEKPPLFSMEALRLLCYACGHSWYRRGERMPKRCPNCQCRTWYNPNRLQTRRRATQEPLPTPETAPETPTPAELPRESPEKGPQLPQDTPTG